MSIFVTVALLLRVGTIGVMVTKARELLPAVKLALPLSMATTSRRTTVTVTNHRGR